MGLPGILKNKLQLPLRCFEEEFKLTRTRKVLQYRELTDPKVVKVGIELRTGKKWEVVEGIQQAETRLHQSKLLREVTQGAIFSDNAKRNERSCESSNRGGEAMHGGNGAAGCLHKVGQCSGEEGDMGRVEAHQIKILILVVYDMVSRLSNLNTWGKAEILL